MLVAAIGSRGAFTIDEWRAVASTRRDLVQPRPREGVNPFSGQQVVLPTIPDAVDIVVAGVDSGGIEPSSEFDDDGCLLVYAAAPVPAPIELVVSEIATALRADIEWMVEL